MGIAVKLEAFEGPLDLLLHLIDKNKVNIYDIPIVEITEQYMEYMNEMGTKDLNLMSEFLVMASTLIHIKSMMLLPKDEKKEEEEDDPRKELVERLLEYKMYKYISYELKDKETDASKVIFKQATVPDEIACYKEEVDTATLLSGLTLTKLHAIYQSVIKKQMDKVDPVRSKFGQIEKEEINLSDKMTYIEEYAKSNKSFSFRKLLNEQCTKMEIIVSFLCILELMKIGKINIVQDNIFDDILIMAC